ncbi:MULTISPECIES: histidine phosphatase family protein [unclassified Streptomyces]|uniref:histidine phosphatase family protein n=1 Tax=unclassified Streptomyces TaxID=2593676 RepID=UPI00136C14DE|nr:MULTISPECIES: histidine phosphatase family protein [unclassified Streptomyces]MCW5250420.1 histidine phosphatase family protein [Streptomyces sp. SHP 1-2]MYU25057.1 histidine phosphatase family protein [Streptomyces sp. SID8352]
MTSRVFLVAPALNSSARQARFDDGAPLDAAGRALAERAARSLPSASGVVVSPTARARETAAALGLAGEEVAALGPLDVGAWRGRTLDEVTGADPGAVARWLGDPESAPHGGEPLAGLCARVGDWLTGVGASDGRVLAVVEPDVVRAAVTRALGAPPQVFWRLDVLPLTVTVLTGRSGRWNLRPGTALCPPGTRGEEP